MPVFEHGARDDSGVEVVTDRILTVPNLISFVRLAALPFLYVDIVRGNAGRALIVLVAISWSDWIDGYVARRFHQVSRLGRLADPITDRLLVAVVGVGFVVGGILPLWAVVAVLARDVALLTGGAVVLVRYGIRPPPVTDLGKSATFGLMSALPMFLLAAYYESANLRGGAWLVLVTFGALYWASAFQYVVIVRRTLRRSRTTRDPGHETQAAR